MQIITTQTLIDTLLARRGATFATIVTQTQPKLKKENPYKGRIVLRSAERRVMLGANYQNVVKNRRENEGHPSPAFRAESLWNGKGEHVEGHPMLVRHRDTGKLYLVFYPFRDGGGVSQDVWSVEGERVPAEEITPYLQGTTQSSGRQETANPVPWRTVALENLSMISLDGETYLVQ